MARLRFLRTILTCASACFALPQKGIEVQVMPPWHVSKNSSISTDRTPYRAGDPVPQGAISHFLPYLMPSLIKGLERKGFVAYPALFASGVQMTRDFASREEIDDMLGQEPPQQRKYPTVVPVFQEAQVVQRSMMIANQSVIQFRLELYFLDARGKLGRLFFARNFSFPVQSGAQTDWEDLVRSLPILEKEIVALDAWDSVAVALPGLASGLATSFKATPDSVKDYDDERHYFAQSEVLINTRRAQAQLSVASFTVSGKDAKDLDDLHFPFMGNDKWPTLLYAYILKPDRTVVRIDLNEAHIEQSPGAIPSKIYDWGRVFVVNLPGLVPGSVVTYAVNFRRPTFDNLGEWRARESRPPRLGKDIPVLAAEGNPFQIRIWSDAGDSVRFKAHDAILDETLILPVSSQALSVVIGRGARVPVRGESADADPFHPIVRLSNLPDWNELLEGVRDSVFARLPPQPHVSRRRNREDDLEYLLEYHRFIQDSLRYISLSFGERSYVPAYPEEVIKQRMGDCKDFSVLLIARLREQGIRANPVLLHSGYKRNLFDGPPSFEAYNHMIVHIPQWNWWVDPTGPVRPPDMLPYELSGARVLVLYEDSVSIKTIPLNADSLYARKITFNCREDGENLSCRWSALFSQSDSWSTRAYLRPHSREKWADLLYPNRWDGAFRITETDTKILNFNSEKEKLRVERTFTAYRAVSKVGGKSMVRFPETPFARIFYLAPITSSAQDPLLIEEPVLQTVDFTLDSEKPVGWPSFPKFEKDGISLTVSKVDDRTVRVLVKIPAGTLQPKEKESLLEMLRQYKDFFASSWTAG